MAVEISMREFDPWVREAYAKFFPGDSDKTSASLEWRFHCNPHGSGRIIAAEVDGEPAGMIALMPTKLANVAEGCSFAYQAIDGVVDPRFRGRGLFVDMGSVAHQPELHGGSLVWGFPNANAAPAWFGRSGWTNLGVVPMLLRPLRSGYLLGRLHPALRKLDVPLLGRSQAQGEEYSDGQRMASDVARLWEKERARHGIAVDRTEAWLLWRLSDKPSSGYRCVGLHSDGGDLLAFVATKVTTKHGASICYVMEALCAQSKEGLLSRLLESELSNARSSGAEVALAWCATFAPSYRSFRGAGFIPMPRWVRPIEINFGGRALDTSCAAATSSGAQWYLSYLDSDTN